MPSRFLQEIPAELIDWRQSPGDGNSRGGTQSRALNARRPGSGGSWGGALRGLVGEPRYGDDLVPKSTSIERFANRIPAKVRDNGDLALAPGDRIRHDDFGEGASMPSPARAPSASRTCSSTRRGRRSCSSRSRRSRSSDLLAVARACLFTSSGNCTAAEGSG